MVKRRGKLTASERYDIAYNAKQAEAAVAKPSKPLSSHPDFTDYGICSICKGTSTGNYGVMVRDNSKPAWSCLVCGPRAARYFALRGNLLNRIEGEAAELAGNKAGQFLDTLGKTDLATLTSHEYTSFLRQFLANYIIQMRALTAHELPEE